MATSTTPQPHTADGIENSTTSVDVNSGTPLGPERICLQTVQLGAAKKYLERRLRRYVGPAVRIPFPQAASRCEPDILETADRDCPALVHDPRVLILNAQIDWPIAAVPTCIGPGRPPQYETTYYTDYMIRYQQQSYNVFGETKDAAE